jgi:hypothetical protein
MRGFVFWLTHQCHPRKILAKKKILGAQWRALSDDDKTLWKAGTVPKSTGN